VFSPASVVAAITHLNPRNELSAPTQTHFQSPGYQLPIPHHQPL